MCMFVSESPYSHLVKTLVASNVEYKYIDITAIEPSYGVFLKLAMVVVNCALISQSYAIFVCCCDA